MVKMQFDDLTEEYLEALSLLMRQPKAKQTTKMHSGEIGILCFLGQHEGYVTPGQLQKALNVGSSRIANALSTLENKGLISRKNCLEDKRKTYVSLTDLGYKELNRQWKEYYMHNRDVLMQMGEDDAKEYIRLFKLYSQINAALLEEKKG